ncbi:MAG: MFS transporter [Opitutae bacterium]|nr:MFS transporter [Opitutae bacterium]
MTTTPFQTGCPAPAADPDATAQRFRYWQMRTLAGTLVGYAVFYLVRTNLNIAMPAMKKALGISYTDLGLFLTLNGVLYGVSKFANGFLADRSDARKFMVIGLVLTASANLCFGLSSSTVVLGLLWMANGWFQGMGYPPCARLMTHWFSPKELATKMSIWNTSTSLGAGLGVVAGGYLVVVGWRWCFLTPAFIAFACAIGLWYTLRDTPSSVGLPEIALTEHTDIDATDKKSQEFKYFLRKKVFGNRYIWLVSVANFFVYTLRYAVLSWGPTLLHETKGMSIQQAGWGVGVFEVCGVAGMLAAGTLTDRIFGGRGHRACLFFLILATVAVFLFWKLPSQSAWVSMGLLGMSGFFIYGPQAVIGIVAANLATKRAAATAVGLTGIFGYASAVVSGWGLGRIVELYGWDAGFTLLMFAGVAGIFTLFLAWPAKAHGYAETPASSQ